MLPAASAAELVEVDGLSIHWQAWPTERPARAAFLIVHGLAEHGGRYAEFVEHFRAVGVVCHALDLRGHGRSDGVRVHVESFDDYVRDVAAVQARIADRHPDLPLFLVGHSMGGVVVLRYLLRGSVAVAGAIVSSPALAPHPDVRPSPFIRLMAKLLRRLAPRLQVKSGVPARYISRDPRVVAAYEADPLVTCTASSGWYHALIEAQRDVLDRAADLSLPILLMQSGDDRLVDPATTERWVRAAPTRHVTYHRWTALYHEMFHEPEKDEVFEFAGEWLERRLGQPAGTLWLDSRHEVAVTELKRDDAPV